MKLLSKTYAMSQAPRYAGAGRLHMDRQEMKGTGGREEIWADGPIGAGPVAVRSVLKESWTLKDRIRSHLGSSPAAQRGRAPTL